MRPPGTNDANLLDAKQLRLFDLLHRTGSVTRTAEQLGQSQPTISIWLARLRRDLGDPLFIRTPSGMEPTPRAEALIGTARQALEALRRLAAWEDAFTPATAQRRFRICMTDASHVALLPHILRHVRAAAPHVRIEAAQINADTARALQSGDADLALGFIPELEAGFFQQTLYPQDWVCLVNAAHPRVTRSLPLETYRREEHIGIVSGTGAQLLAAAMERHKVERRLALELPGFLGLPAIIGTTDLIATLPRHIGETLAGFYGLRVLPCPVEIPGFNVKQHWHARFHHDAGNLWLRKVCAELFQQRAVRRAGAATAQSLRKAAVASA
ncbi:MAG: LysR family transcriptional regulator [Rhodospirillales bacterium]|nr:LysR family transcriptional regulator [Rhodospirillales bacterium]